MIDTLAIFADQVTNVAREVGIEGKLGGQARVPGAAGLWRDLTDNVNRLAANLTTQVRAIAEVATAVTKGDLTRSITVEAQGEVASLKDNINEMIRNLKDTTRKNTEQDWLKTHLARFTRMLQGHRDLVTVSRLILSRADPAGERAAGRVLRRRPPQRRLAARAARRLRAAPRQEPAAQDRASARAWSGSARSRRSASCCTQAPSDYVRIGSALGSGAPVNIIILPVLFEGQVKAVIELASFCQVQRDPPDLPRPAHRVDRRGAAHHRGEHADRVPAAPVAVADRRAAEPAGGAEEDQRPPGAAGAQPAEVRGAAQVQAGRAALRQRAAAGEGAPALRADAPGRVQEPRDRAGARGAGGEGRAAVAVLALQVRVPRQHVARAAHAAQQPADPGAPAGRQRRRQPHAEAGRVRAHHPLLGRRAARADQRHPRPGEDRVGHRDAEHRAPSASTTCADYVERTFRQMASDKGLEFAVALERRAAAGDARPTASACSRSSPTCCRTRSSSPAKGERALRDRAGRPPGWTPRPPGARPRRHRWSRSR